MGNSPLLLVCTPNCEDMGRKRKHQPASNASLSPLKKPVGASRDAEAQRGDVVPPTLQIVACTANDALRDVLSSGHWELSCCSHSCNCQAFTLQAEGLLCANCSHRAAAHKLAVKQLAGPVSTQRLQQLFVHVRSLRAAAADDNTACWGRSWGSQHVQKMLAAVRVDRLAILKLIICRQDACNLAQPL
jgi:hypothetical protein